MAGGLSTSREQVTIGDTPVLIKPADGGADAFGRFRVSEPLTLFDSTLQYSERADLYYTKTAGAASITHLPDQSSVLLDVTGAGDSVIRQSRQYLRYQPGKSLLFNGTFLFGAQVAGITRWCGYGDDLNGIFLKQDGTIGPCFCRRSNVTGSVVEETIPQASWNRDTLDGTGPSGVTLDLTKVQILVIDLEWLGVGRVRCGFNIDGVTIYCHEFDHANIITSTYITSANLPVRYEIESTGPAADMKQICAQVASEGGFNEARGVPFGYSTDVVSQIATPALVPFLSLRPKATFNGIVNRSTIIPLTFEFFVSSNPIYWELIYGGTLTGATFSIDPGGTAEADDAATAISGGITIQSGYAAAGGNNARNANGNAPNSVFSRLPLTLDIDGLNPTNLTLAIQELDGGNPEVWGAFNTIEYF